jgi:hypothetical protein
MIDKIITAICVIFFMVPCLFLLVLAGALFLQAVGGGQCPRASC